MFAFPSKFTCFEHFEWAISKKEVEDVRIWYELWAKVERHQIL